MLNTILSLGTIFIIGLFGARIFSRINLPSVTAYIVFGIILGPYVLNFVSPDMLQSSTLISTIALSLVAFSLGQNFTISKLHNIGKSIFAISIGEVLGSFILVSLAVFLIARQSLSIALILGAIAPATAPAAVVMVTREYRARGRFTDTLLGVVAIDDAWSIMLFAFCIAIAKSLTGAHTGIFANIFSDILHGFWEVLGGLALGIIIGFIFSYFLKYINTLPHLLIYILGLIFINTGVSILLNVSLLLANMALGATVANKIKMSENIFDVLRGFDPPIYLLFFILAGANLEIPSVYSLSVLGILYVLTRLPGEMLGAFIGALIAKADKNIKRYLGLGLAPQAGVAIGLALLTKNYFPGPIGEKILSTIIVTTIIYELIGPFLVRIALEKAGEIDGSTHIDRKLK
jgi:Kef-type K+ transport system membrane component KefB